MDMINIILTIFSIIVTIFGVVIPIRHEKKSKLPKLSLSYIPFGMETDDEKDKQVDYVLKGYFQKQKELDKRLHAFLVKNNCDLEFMNPNFIGTIADQYKKKEYYKFSEYIAIEAANKIIREFIKNEEFLDLINEYEEYRRTPRWILNISNVGNTSAMDFTIDLFRENRGSSMCKDSSLNPNDKRTIALYYFDISAIMDPVNKHLYWNTDITMNFYLVEEKKYNKKDERLFLIVYKDIYEKYHKVYCCAKVGKNILYNPMGAE